VSLVITYPLNEKIKLSGTWVYGTGNAVNLPNREYSMVTPESNVYHEIATSTRRIDDYEGMNEFRMQPYHRLDVGIQFFKEKKRGGRTWEVSFYNAYNRKNPFYYYTKQTDYDQEKPRTKLMKVSLFPIVPSVSYTRSF
jgi:hypothetical protein